MPESPGKRLALRAHEISRGAPLERLPTPEKLAQRSEAERHELLEGLRVELFAISSLLADAAVGRARRERPAFPPYGLVRSRYTELRMIVAEPEPFEAGAIGDFHALGKAYIDTTIFHLHGSFAELGDEGKGWLVDRLEKLLELYRVGAGPATQARMRDGISFVYGGLQFGTAICVQLAEVMSSMLATGPGLAAGEKAAVLTRSSLPAYDLAAFSVTGVLRAFQSLQSTTRRSVAGISTQTWMDPARFVVREADGRPWRIDLAEDDLLGSAGPAPEGLHSYTTLGCPARISPSGSISPIATLWGWCIELAQATGLLGPPDGA